MRHHSANRKFGLKRNQRNALMRSLVRSLVVHGKIETTVEKAKEIRPFVEKLVTIAKKNTLAGKRIIASRTAPTLIGKFTALGVKYASRPGGYTRITRVWRKTADGSRRAYIEFV